MHMIDYILILLIAAAVVLAVRTAVQRKKAGKTCCGDCTACEGMRHAADKKTALTAGIR